MDILEEIFWLSERKEILRFLLDSGFRTKSRDDHYCVYLNESDLFNNILAFGICEKRGPFEKQGLSGYVETKTNIVFEFYQISHSCICLMLSGFDEIASSFPSLKATKIISSGISFVKNEFYTCFHKNEDSFCVYIRDKRDLEWKLLLLHGYSPINRNSLCLKPEIKAKTIKASEIRSEYIFPGLVNQFENKTAITPISQIMKDLGYE